MTVVKNMENTLNPSLIPCKSELQKYSLPKAKKGKRTVVENSLEVELINGKRKSRRGRPSQCTEFWLMYKANSEKKCESSVVEPKSQAQTTLALEKTSFQPPAIEKSSSPLPMSTQISTPSSPMTPITNPISTGTFTNKFPTSLSPTFTPRTKKRRPSDIINENEQASDKIMEISRTATAPKGKRRKLKEEHVNVPPNNPGAFQETSTESNHLLCLVDFSISRSSEQKDIRERGGLSSSSQESPVQPVQTVAVATRHSADATSNDRLERPGSSPKSSPGLAPIVPASNKTRVGSLSSNYPGSENITKWQYFNGQIFPNEFTFNTTIMKRIHETSWMEDPTTVNRLCPLRRGKSESPGKIVDDQECLNLSSEKAGNLPNSLKAHSSQKMSERATSQANSSSNLPVDLSLRALDLSTSRAPLDLRCH